MPAPPLAPVVCALDPAPASEPALVAAVGLSARVGGRLHLVTVRPPVGPDEYRAPSDPEAAVRAVVEVAVDRALGAGACAEIAPEIAVAREADPAASVADYAERVGAGTLVLGTHGRVGLQRFLLGSVAEAVVRRTPCPVLVVPNRSAGRLPGPGRPVLVPVDFSEHSARALAVAAPLADLHDAPVEVVHVVDPLADASLAAGAAASVAVGVPAQDPPSEADVRAFAEAAGCLPAAVHVMRGRPADGVVRCAEVAEAGAVVMGTHGRGGAARVLLGSVTEAALRRLSCPLLAVRPARP